MKTIWELTCDVVPDLIAILNKEHRIVQVNKAMANAWTLRRRSASEGIALYIFMMRGGTACVLPYAQLVHDCYEHTAEVYACAQFRRSFSRDGLAYF